MTDVTQSRAPSPKPTNTRAAVASSHAKDDPQSDNQEYLAIEDSNPGTARSTNESSNVCDVGLGHNTLIDGATSIKV